MIDAAGDSNCFVTTSEPPKTHLSNSHRTHAQPTIGVLTCCIGCASLSSHLSAQLTCVNLIDSHHCSDPAKFLSVLLISLCSMTQLELPHVNILSKMDLIEMYGELEFGIEFYTDVLDLSYILPRLKSTSSASHPLTKKFAKLNKAIAELVEMYNLVSFVPLDIQNQELLVHAIKLIDKANGYVYVQQINTGQGAAGSTTTGQDAAAKAHNERLMTMTHKIDQTELHMYVHSHTPRTLHRRNATRPDQSHAACYEFCF